MPLPRPAVCVTRVDDIIVKISLSPKYRVFSTISFGIALGDSTNLRCWPSISVGDSTDIRYWSRIGSKFPSSYQFLYA